MDPLGGDFVWGKVPLQLASFGGLVASELASIRHKARFLCLYKLGITIGVFVFRMSLWFPSNYRLSYSST